MTHPTLLGFRLRIQRQKELLAFFLLLMVSYQPLKAQNLEWVNTIGDTFLDEVSDIARDPSGNIYVTGIFKGNVDFDPLNSPVLLNSSDRALFLAKYDSQGNLSWVFPVVTADPFIQVTSITTDDLGNVAIAGMLRGTADFDPSPAVLNITSGGGFDVFMAKYNSSGQLLWAESIGIDASGLGDPKIVMDQSSNLYLVGTFTKTVDFDPSNSTRNLVAVGDQDAYLAKYNKTGNLLWVMGIGSPDRDRGLAVGVDNNQNVLLSGFMGGPSIDFDPGPGVTNVLGDGFDMFLAKYDSLGAFIWAFNAGGPGNFSGGRGTDIAIDQSNNVCLTGTFSGTVDFDPSANTASINALGLTNAFVAQYDQFGNYNWAVGLEGSGGFFEFSEGQAVAVNSTGEVFITGKFTGQVEFDPSPNSNVLVSAFPDSLDVYVAKYDGQGNHQWAFSVGSSFSDVGNGFALDEKGGLYVGGKIAGVADFDPTSSVVNPSFFGVADGFLAKYSEAQTGIVQECLSIVSDASWSKSSVITPSNLSGRWNGVSQLPSVATFSQPVDIGQPYGYPSINVVDSTDVITTHSGITYFRKEFSLSGSPSTDARMQINVDDQADIYINGTRLALITNFGRRNFKFPAYDIMYSANGTVDNGFMGGDIYNFAATLNIDTLLKMGTNEIIIAVRNLGKAKDKGGLSFRMDLGCPVVQAYKTASANAAISHEGLQLYPNPVVDKVYLKTDLAIVGLAIYDLSGKLILEREEEVAKEVVLEMSDLDKGIYLLELTELGGETYTKKLVKK